MKIRTAFLLALVLSGAGGFVAAGNAEPEPEPGAAIGAVFDQALPRLGPSFAGAGATTPMADPVSPPSTADSRQDPLGDVMSRDGQTVEPRADVSALSLRYGADVLEISVTVPGGVDPTSSANWRGNISGVAAAMDVNGDDVPDFASVFVVDANGKILVGTIAAPPTPDPTTAPVPSLCMGTGSYNAGARTHVLTVPSACLGNAYEVRAAAMVLFNRNTAMADGFDITFDLVPSSRDLPGVHRDTARNGAGYRFVAGDGGIFTFGALGFHGSTGAMRLNKPIVGMDATRTDNGYWLVASDGGIFTFGDAGFFGSAGDIKLNRPIVGMAATPTGGGYWLVADDGGIFTYGDALFHGSPAAGGVTRPVVGMAATATGRGYWLALADGTVLPFGDAASFGSAGGGTSPVVGISATPSGRGYWIARADGTVTAVGDAVLRGDASMLSLSAPIVGVASTPTGRGYWLLGRDGGVFTYGDAAFHGSTGDLRLNQPVLDLAP